DGTAKRPRKSSASATRRSSTRSRKTVWTRPHDPMTTSAFYEDDRLLTSGAFEFVLDSELKRAVRSQNYLTLVTVETGREWDGMTVTADDGTLHEIASIIGHEIRDTDLLGHAERGTLALVLLDSDFGHSTKVIDRLVSRLESYE